jgi:hypothetical protein
MAKFTRRSAFKLVGGLFAFIPVVKYLADTAPAHADGNPILIPGCQSCQPTPATTYCNDSGTGQKTIWAVYICFGCPAPNVVQSVAVDTGVPC